MSRYVLKETGVFAPRWDAWRAYDVETGKVLARGPDRWTTEAKATTKGHEAETSLERFQRRGNT